MSTTSFSTSDVQTRKAWSDRVSKDVTLDTEIVSGMISDGTLIKQDELTKGAGDEVKYHFLRRIK